MYNALPQSQQDENTERGHRAAIAHVREQESCHFYSGFTYCDGLHETSSVPPSAGGSAVRYPYKHVTCVHLLKSTSSTETLYLSEPSLMT